MMKKIASLGVGIFIICSGISSQATSLSSINLKSQSSPLIKSRAWSVSATTVVKQPGGTGLKGQNGWGVSMDECRTEISETRREVDECYGTLNDAETSSVSYTNYNDCNTQEHNLYRALDECRTEHERLSSSGREGTSGTDTTDTEDDFSNSSSTTVRVRWDDPRCTTPDSSKLASACLGDCENYLSIEIDSLRWCREVVSDTESYFSRLFSECQADVTRLQEELDQEGCTNGTVVTPPSGIGTCSATGCR